jgi:hypothetical protein
MRDVAARVPTSFPKNNFSGAGKLGTPGARAPLLSPLMRHNFITEVTWHSLASGLARSSGAPEASKIPMTPQRIEVFNWRFN